MKKKYLRNVFSQKRKALEPSEYEKRNHHLRAYLLNGFNFSKINYLHTFLPIKANNEVDTWAIMEDLNRNFDHIQWVVPKCNPDSVSMNHYLYDDEVKIEVNKWGIPEPVDGNLVEPDALDMVLVPLLTFDLEGNRVGYGKGFYDRFLAQCRQDTVKTGLSLDMPTDKIEDINDFDIPIDKAVTPYGIWTFY